VLSEGHIVAQGSVTEMDQSNMEVVRQFMSATRGD